MAMEQLGGDKERLLFHFLHVIFKRKWLIISLFFSTMIMVIFFTILMTPMWEATTLILVESNPKKQMVLFPDIATPGAQTSPSTQSQNLVQLLTGRNMAYEVVGKFGIDKLVEERENNPKALRDIIKKEVKDFFLIPVKILRELGVFGEKRKDYADDAADEIIDDWEDIEVVEETQVISLTIKGYTPKLAEDVANFMADSLIRRTVTLSNDEIKRTYNDTEKNFSGVEKDLRTAQEQLKRFRENEKVISLNEEERAKISQYNEVETKYNLSLNEKNTLTAKLQELDRQLKARDNKVVTSTTLASNPLITDLKTALNESEVKMFSMLKDRKESHPDVRKIKAEIETIKDHLKNEVEKVVQSEVVTTDPIYQSLLAEFTTTETRRYTIESELAGLSRVMGELNKELLKFPAKEIEYARLASKVEMYQNLAGNLKRKVEELRIVKESNLNEVSLRIIDKAYVSPLRKPEWPKWVLTIVAGIILALGFSFSYPFFLEYWNDTIARRRDIEDLIGVPVLGTITYNRRLRRWNKKGNGFYDVEKDPALLNMLRRIATNLMLVSGRDNRRIFLVTSYSPLEGKTTVASSLSKFFSVLNKDTLIITNPTEKANKMIEGEVPDFERAITQGYKMELMKETNGDACYLMYYDIFSLNLSNTEILNNFFEQTKNNFDIAFIDSPSMSDSQLPLFMSQMVDGVILIVDKDTRREQIRLAKKKIEAANGHLAGVILNRYSRPIPNYISQKFGIEN